MNDRQALQQAFPGLSQSSFAITSPPDPGYNCIAWAAGDCSRWWWPDPRGYWPSGAARAETLAAFEEVYARIGYVACISEELEEDYEKIAVFVDSSGVPTHAARQLPDGTWTSKLGPWHDISHSLKAVEGQNYGRVARIMKRPVTFSRRG